MPRCRHRVWASLLAARRLLIFSRFSNIRSHPQGLRYLHGLRAFPIEHVPEHRHGRSVLSGNPSSPAGVLAPIVAGNYPDLLLHCTARLQLQRNERVIQIFGEPLKAYGQDHGGHKEGRRNFIEHREEAVRSTPTFSSHQQTHLSHTSALHSTI